MKKLIIPAFVLALAAGAPAIAWSQDDQHDKDRPHAQAGQGDEAKPDQGDRHQDKTPTPKTDRNNTTDHSGPNNAMTGNAMSGAEKNKADERDRTRDLNRNYMNRNNNNNNNNANDRDNNHDRDNDHRNDNNFRNNNNDRDHRDNNRTNVRVNINIGSYRKTVTASHHFRIGVYRAPAHYSYRRWSIGERLPSVYFVRDYWLTDYAAYDLVAPPDGYVWVRFGPDAILIDEYSGEVVQVVFGVFI